MKIHDHKKWQKTKVNFEIRIAYIHFNLLNLVISSSDDLNLVMIRLTNECNKWRSLYKFN